MLCHHQGENMKRHTSHTATAPSTHSPSRILVPSRQPRINARKLKGGIGTLLVVRRLAPAGARADTTSDKRGYVP
jgi:hypothetical protein